MAIQRNEIRQAHVKTLKAEASRHDLPLKEILSTLQRFGISAFFTQTRQSNFVESMMIIKTGSSRPEGEADIKVIRKMKTIYDQSNRLGKVEHLVCKALIKRIEGGLSLGEAMSGIFSDQYCNLISAMSEGDNIVDAVKSATIRQKESIRTEVMSFVKVGGGYLFFLFICNLINYVYEIYIERKAEVPKAFRFFTEPEAQFAIANLVAQFTVPILITTFFLLLVNRKILPKLSGERRLLFDSYYPPAWLYKRKVAIGMFSSITLLIKDAGVKPIMAVSTLIKLAPPYEKDHLNMIKASISRGDDGTQQFSTGLLPKPLELQLQLAGQGESASVDTALHIICNTGQAELLKSMNRMSTYLLLAFIIFGAWVGTAGIITGFQLFKSISAS
ncbi:hypothetical protein M3899_003213 [Vibrio parahaemolyticus]|nr:hypothetical protein [Vibrio parahaemolyticus]